MIHHTGNRRHLVKRRKQYITITRTLIKQAAHIGYKSASAPDAESERYIMDVINSPHNDHTILISIHYLENIANADGIVVMYNGNYARKNGVIIISEIYILNRIDAGNLAPKEVRGADIKPMNVSSKLSLFAGYDNELFVVKDKDSSICGVLSLLKAAYWNGKELHKLHILAIVACNDKLDELIGKYFHKH